MCNFRICFSVLWGILTVSCREISLLLSYYYKRIAVFTGVGISERISLSLSRGVFDNRSRMGTLYSHLPNKSLCTDTTHLPYRQELAFVTPVNCFTRILWSLDFSKSTFKPTTIAFASSSILSIFYSRWLCNSSRVVSTQLFSSSRVFSTLLSSKE